MKNLYHAMNLYISLIDNMLAGTVKRKRQHSAGKLFQYFTDFNNYILRFF